MPRKIHRNDIWRVGAPAVAVSQKIPATLVMSSQWYLDLAAAVPDWIFPASLGFAVAVWLLDPWTDDSRLRQFWSWLTDRFVVEDVLVAHWDWMPDTDIGLKVMLRFTRRIKNGRLILRVFGCTGRGRKPDQWVIPLATVNCERGERLLIPVVDMATPRPGWDHSLPRGWGPTKDGMPSFSHDSNNVAIIELRSRWIVQKFKLFVRNVPNAGQPSTYTIYVQDQNDDVFDSTGQSRLGRSRYDG